MKKIVLLFYCVTLFQIVQAQRSTHFISPGRLLLEGQSMYNDKNYAGCIDKITEYKKQAGHREEMEEPDFLLAASAFHQGRDDAGTVLMDVLQSYPSTGHRNELCFMIGSVFFRAQDYARAEYWLQQCNGDLLPEDETADYTFRRGMIHLKNGNDKEAGRLFALLSAYGKYKEASEYYLAYVSYKEGDYDRALNRFLPLKTHPEFKTDVLYYITQIYFAQNKYTQVIREGQSLLQTCPGHAYNSEIERITGISYYHENDYAQAIQYLKPLLDKSSAYAGADYYMLGLSYYNLQQYAQAIEYLSKSDPGNDLLGQSAYLYLGQSYLQQKDKNNALRAFESASRMNFDASAKEAALYNYAMLLHQNSVAGFGESVTVMENFINTYPRSIYADKVNDALGDVYMTTKNYDTALASIAKIKNPDRKIIEAKQKIYYYLGTVDFTNGKYDPAIDYFTKAIASGETAVNEKQQAVYWRGESHYRKADYERAAQDYQAFLNTGNTSGDLAAMAIYNLGYCAFKQSEYTKAGTFFQTFINRERNNKNTLADAYARLGDCYFNNRQFKEAENAYRQAVVSSPAAGDYALFQQGYVMGLQKDYKGKVAKMDQLINDFPHSPYITDAIYEKGRAYVLLNNPAAAIETYQMLMKAYSSSQLARSAGLQTGLLYFNTNQPEKAIAAYKNVIAQYPGSEEAKEAIQDLKSVYLDRNDLPAYVEYVKSLGDKTLETESIQYSEEAIGRQAEIQYNNKQYEAAMKLYQQLQMIATGKTNRTIGTLGVLRSATQLNEYNTMIRAAGELLKDNTLSPETANEAKYCRAKAYLSLGENKQAEPDLEELARDTRTVQGAEARYLLAQHYFDTGNAVEAKIVIQDYIQQGTPHAYWLAKSFILLSDIYASENDLLQARQYLESLQTNYKNTNDDIQRIIKERLGKLKIEN
jgi:tetratricopeptide (TPR) repeat protein